MTSTSPTPSTPAATPGGTLRAFPGRVLRVAASRRSNEALRVAPPPPPPPSPPYPSRHALPPPPPPSPRYPSRHVPPPLLPCHPSHPDPSSSVSPHPDPQNPTLVPPRTRTPRRGRIPPRTACSPACSRVRGGRGRGQGRESPWSHVRLRGRRRRGRRRAAPTKAAYGHAAVGPLPEKGANPVVRDGDGGTPLHDASAGGFDDVVDAPRSREDARMSLRGAAARDGAGRRHTRRPEGDTQSVVTRPRRRGRVERRVVGRGAHAVSLAEEGGTPNARARRTEFHGTMTRAHTTQSE